MIGGVMIPGKPVANMYFTLYGYQTYTLTLNLLRDLKLVGLNFVLTNGWFCQYFIGSIHKTSTSCYIRCTDNWRCYRKPPIYSCYQFIWVPCMQGGLLNYVVMKSVLSANREVLLDVQGTNVWSGQAVSPSCFGFFSIFNVDRRSNRTTLMPSRGVLLVNLSTHLEADTE